MTFEAGIDRVSVEIISSLSSSTSSSSWWQTALVVTEHVGDRSCEASYSDSCLTAITGVFIAACKLIDGVRT